MLLNKMFSPLLIKIGGYALGCVVVLSVGISIGYKYTKYKYDSAYKESYAAMAKQLNESNARNQKLQEATDALKADYQKKIEGVNEKVKTEIKLVPVYQSCIVPDSGMQLCKSAANNTNQAIAS